MREGIAKQARAAVDCGRGLDGVRDDLDGIGKVGRKTEFCWGRHKFRVLPLAERQPKAVYEPAASEVERSTPELSPIPACRTPCVSVVWGFPN